MASIGKGADQGMPTSRRGAGTPGRKSVPWRKDVVVLARMAEVETRHIAGETNVAIAAALKVDEKTIRRDLERLRELWKERIGEKGEALRAEAAVRLDDIMRRALKAAEFDEEAERFVLYGARGPASEESPPILDDDDEWDDDEPTRPALRMAQRITFRGQKAQALGVARQAVMDKARLLGLVVEKRELTGKDGAPLISVIEAIPPVVHGD